MLKNIINILNNQKSFTKLEIITQKIPIIIVIYYD